MDCTFGLFKATGKRKRGDVLRIINEKGGIWD
jgi:hypothetical protein